MYALKWQHIKQIFNYHVSVGCNSLVFLRYFVVLGFELYSLDNELLAITTYMYQWSLLLTKIEEFSLDLLKEETGVPHESLPVQIGGHKHNILD